MRLWIKRQVDTILALRWIAGRMRGDVVLLANVILARGDAERIRVVNFHILYSWHPLSDDRINTMHKAVQPTGTFTT